MSISPALVEFVRSRTPGPADTVPHATTGEERFSISAARMRRSWNSKGGYAHGPELLAMLVCVCFAREPAGQPDQSIREA